MFIVSIFVISFFSGDRRRLCGLERRAIGDYIHEHMHSVPELTPHDPSGQRVLSSGCMARFRGRAPNAGA